MAEIFIALLNMSLTASFVIAAVCLARLFLRRAPKIITYALWAVVLFHLVCPFKPASTFSLIPFQAQPIPYPFLLEGFLMEGEKLTFFGATDGAAGILAPGNDSYGNIIDPAADPSGDPEQGQSPSYGFDSYGFEHYVLDREPLFIFLSYLWLIGVAAMLLYAAAAYLRLQRRVALAVRVEGNVYETDRIESPFVLGLIRPRIYLPTGMALTEYGCILEHERTHLRRRDYLTATAAFAALALHWFNPLVWAAYFLMLRDMESSCDEAVLRRADEDIRRAYSTALLSFSGAKKSLPLPLAFGEQGVKSRIKNVLRFKKPPRRLVALAIALAVALAVALSAGLAVVKLPDGGEAPALAPVEFLVDTFPENYSLFMSSTPGIRLTVTYTGPAAQILYETAAGEFLSWENSRITRLGSSVLRPTNTLSLFWSPVSDPEVDVNVITLTAVAESGEKLANRVVTISRDKGGYTAFCQQPQSTETLAAMADTVNKVTALEMIVNSLTYYNDGETEGLTLSVRSEFQPQPLKIEAVVQPWKGPQAATQPYDAIEHVPHRSGPGLGDLGGGDEPARDGEETARNYADLYRIPLGSPSPQKNIESVCLRVVFSDGTDRIFPSLYAEFQRLKQEATNPAAPAPLANLSPGSKVSDIAAHLSAGYTFFSNQPFPLGDVYTH